MGTPLGLFESDQRDVGRKTALQALREAAQICARCSLSETRERVVFGEGRTSNPLVALVGEAPGATEDREGRPFCGRSGELLDRMLSAIDLARDQVYVCNVVCCRPPQNRTPEPSEISACRKLLEKQLELVAPKIIVALGRTAAHALLTTKKNKIPELRGVWYSWRETPLRVTWHPAALLREPAKKQESWQDLLAVRDRLHLEEEVRGP